jgi:mannitol-1-phosphate/altronate dehydrogenase
MYIEEEAKQFFTQNIKYRSYNKLEPITYTEESKIIDVSNKAVFLNKKDMHREWMAKLYIHNTPHCITAYMGHEQGKRYIHEAMELREITDVIYGVVLETGAMVQKVYGLDEDFVTSYALKELTRFSNPLLFDPISRVAREPMRKLALSERLIGAAMLCLQVGITPTNIIRGIVSAIHFCEPKDPDYRIMKLFNQLDVEDFVEGILHLRRTEKLYPLLLEALK